MLLLKKRILTLFCLLMPFVGTAQNHGYQYKRATHWYFGNGAGLDFSSGTPVAVTNGALHTYEGCATISDTSGNLLFYTDGDTIWNRNNLPMSNGTGLLGCPLYGSSAQGALIIPQPGNDSLYYVVTTDCAEDTGHFGLRYSVVNMNLNGGLGDVIASSKNILLHTNVTEGQTATYNCNHSVVWLLTHEYNNNNYLAYKISSSGIDTTPIISPIGSIYKYFTTYMRFSPNGKLFASYFVNSSELLKFNQQTGKLSDLIILPPFSGDYGTCFSPDNSKLYFTLGTDICQLNVTNYNYNDIASSKNIITSNNIYTLGAISNAIDNKLYVSTFSTKIGVINLPNIYGNSSNFNANAVSLGGKTSNLGLPDFIQSYFNTSDKSPCADTANTKDTSQVEVSIPNVFTPNGDDINDVFSITIKGYDKVDWQIFNRWGEVVNKGKKTLDTDMKTQVKLWNGKTQAGVKVSDGVYYYIIRLTAKIDKHVTKKGSLELLN